MSRARSRLAGALLAALAWALLPAPAFAQLYRWTDDQGQTHVTQGLDAVPEQYRSGAVIVGGGPEPKAPPKIEALTPKAARPSPAEERARRAAALKQEREEREQDMIRVLDQKRLVARGTQELLAVGREYLARRERHKAGEAADRAAEAATTRSDWLAVGAFYRRLGFFAKADEARGKGSGR
jgi:hypothetical protein